MWDWALKAFFAVVLPIFDLVLKKYANDLELRRTFLKLVEGLHEEQLVSVNLRDSARRQREELESKPFPESPKP